MALRESTFNKSEITEFLLNTGNGFASSCWHNDITTDRPSYTQTSNWFQRYFPSNKNQFMFRLVECHCVQTMEFAE